MTVIAAILAYSAAWFSLLFTATKRKPSSRAFKFIVPIAIALHAWAASESVITEAGIQLGFFQITSVFLVVMNVILALSAIKKPLDKLFLFLLPCSGAALACAELIFTTAPLSNTLGPGLLSHILLSIVAYSLLTLATLQALLLNYQNNRLKSHHVKSILGVFPPLQTMESLLFDLVWAGFILLTLSIATGIVFIDDIFAQNLSHKTVFSLVSWLLYAMLLGGRHILGWRGRAAIRWVILGFIMLMLAYFGSKFVIEVLLD